WAERTWGFVLLIGTAIFGFFLAIASFGDPISIHGVLIFLAELACIVAISGGLHAPEPSDARLAEYYDDPTRTAIIVAMGWVVFGMFVGDWVAWQLVNPDLTLSSPYTSFGRIRPVHTTAVIFGFGGNALIGTSLYVLQRTTRARLRDQLSPWFVLIGYNLFCILAVSGYIMGITQSKEYAEPEWYADILLVIVWVAY